MSTTAAGPQTSDTTLPTGEATRTVRKRKHRKMNPWGVIAWIAGIGFFFPVFWMVLTAFKQESDAYSDPPKFFFTPTLDQFRSVFETGASTALLNSAFATIVSTVFVLLLGVPAAFALSLRPVRRTQDALFFFISTKMLPIVAAIIPLYVIVANIGMLDNIWALIILYTAMNLPIAVWMMRSFFLEVPSELLEPPAWTARACGPPYARSSSARLPWHRRDRAHLRDLLVERILLRRQPHCCASADDSGVHGRLHHR